MELFLRSILDHLCHIFSTFYGWLVALLLLIFNFFAPAYYPFLIVFILILVDLGWGIAVSLKKEDFAYSEAGRETCIKIAIYGCCLGSVYMIEHMFHSGITITSVAAAVAGACEVWSFSASMLIIYPKMPFLRIFRAQLRGEMEKKLGRSINTFLK